MPPNQEMGWVYSTGAAIDISTTILYAFDSEGSSGVRRNLQMGGIILVQSAGHFFRCAPHLRGHIDCYRLSDNWSGGIILAQSAGEIFWCAPSLFSCPHKMRHYDCLLPTERQLKCRQCLLCSLHIYWWSRERDNKSNGGLGLCLADY